MFSYASYTIKPVGLGAVISQDQAKALLQILGNRYASFPTDGNCYIPSDKYPQGYCAPSGDPNADYFVAQAMTQGQPGDMTVLDQLKSLQPGVKALVDTVSAEKVLAGQDVPLFYVLAKNDQVCKYLTTATAYAELPSMGSVDTTAAKDTGIKGTAIIGGLLAAAAGALVAGPAGAVVAGGAVGLYLQTRTA